MEKSNLNIVQQFLRSINDKRLDEVKNLLADDHIFVDSNNNQVKGKDNMLKAWENYFKMFPDYRIIIDDIFSNDNSIVLLGNASGTYSVNDKLKPENHWSIPAAWKCEISNSKIKYWQVYADNSLVKQIINRSS